MFRYFIFVAASVLSYTAYSFSTETGIDQEERLKISATNLLPEEKTHTLDSVLFLTSQEVFNSSSRYAIEKMEIGATKQKETFSRNPDEVTIIIQYQEQLAPNKNRYKHLQYVLKKKPDIPFKNIHIDIVKEDDEILGKIRVNNHSITVEPTPFTF